MRFGPVPIQDALGAILAHSVTLDQGRLRKGKALTSGDIRQLSKAGIENIVVAQLDPNDLHEDAAAHAVATALIAPHSTLELTKATTGRVNLLATKPGIFCCDPQAVAAVNSVNPMITLATLGQYQRVMAGDLVATIKIISYGVPEDDIATAIKAAKPLLVQTAAHTKVTLIETQIGSETPNPKGRTAIATRVDRLGSSLTGRMIVAHTEDALTAAITAADGSVVMILNGSATSDPYDVAPQALRHAGGQVTRFGMPVDPGNLLFVGIYGDKPVIGLPGCARSLALNGADWVIERIICGLPVSSVDIAGMGVGGLLKESPARHHPRHKAKK